MSPIPLTLPEKVYDIDSSSMRVEVSASTSEQHVSLVSLPGSHSPSLAGDLLEGIRLGVPLVRSEELVRLAEEVASRPVGLPHDWAAVLASDFARFND
jgi:hypothetical protein